MFIQWVCCITILRTTLSNHKKRLPLLFDTWITKVNSSQVFLVTDGDDPFTRLMASVKGTQYYIVARYMYYVCIITLWLVCCDYQSCLADKSLRRITVTANYKKILGHCVYNYKCIAGGVNHIT